MMLSAGVDLMFLGMGTVFMFLTILVIGMTIMSWIIGKIEPAEVSASTSSTLQSIDSEIAAAAAIAFVTSKK